MKKFTIILFASMGISAFAKEAPKSISHSNCEIEIPISEKSNIYFSQLLEKKGYTPIPILTDLGNNVDKSRLRGFLKSFAVSEPGIIGDVYTCVLYSQISGHSNTNPRGNLYFHFDKRVKDWKKTGYRNRIVCKNKTKLFAELSQKMPNCIVSP